MPGPDKVADIGAGTGYFSVRIAKRVLEGKVFAVDIEPDMLRYLGERAH
ncbi:MAG: class I SAM-dependent methyltransferase, partial [Xanthobacteraceae bacterium]